MSDDYVSRCHFIIDGEELEDVKSVEDEDIETAMRVNLMYKTGFTGKTLRYGLRVTYAVPSGKPEFAWASKTNSKIVLEDDDGQRTAYEGCRVLSVGGATRDGESEAVRVITIGAKSSQPE